MAQTATVRAPANDSYDFGNEISKKVLDGWTVLSSGFDGPSQCWWAIFLKTEDL